MSVREVDNQGGVVIVMRGGGEEKLLVGEWIWVWARVGFESRVTCGGRVGEQDEALRCLSLAIAIMLLLFLLFSPSILLVECRSNLRLAQVLPDIRQVQHQHYKGGLQHLNNVTLIILLMILS